VESRVSPYIQVYIVLGRPESREDKLRWVVDGISSGLCPVVGVGTAIGWC
jgi:hypothetical protein